MKPSPDFSFVPLDHPLNENTALSDVCNRSQVLMARLYGYDLDDTPLVTGLPGCPGEVFRAESTVMLSRSDSGATVVVLFEADSSSTVILGVVRSRRVEPEEAAPAAPVVAIRADEERIVLEASREIVLRCGAASITLTRAGKVTIQGNYVLSRSTGYNKITGAAVDIN